MRKTIFICGIIGGLISVGWFVIGEQLFGNTMTINTRMGFGYATMILGFSVIFVAVKNYRDNINGGMITFGKGLQIGLLITLIASTVYVAVWMIDFKWFVPGYFINYKSQTLAELKANGATQAVMNAKSTEIDGAVKMYENPFFNALFTYMEILPVGLAVSVVAALILRRKQVAAQVA